MYSIGMQIRVLTQVDFRLIVNGLLLNRLINSKRSDPYTNGLFHWQSNVGCRIFGMTNVRLNFIVNYFWCIAWCFGGWLCVVNRRTYVIWTLSGIFKMYDNVVGFILMVIFFGFSSMLERTDVVR